MLDHTAHLLAGCSFTDPVWQDARPWSLEYSKIHPSFIVAKAGMGIKGICTETMYYLQTLPTVTTVVIMLPNLWRIDAEMDVETNLCNAMVDLLQARDCWHVVQPARRKWVISGGLNYDQNKEQAILFNFLYKHQGFLVIAKEHFRALKILQNFCKQRKINCYISAIQDPLDQLEGLEYIRDDIMSTLHDVEYDGWLKFENQFVDKFLGHHLHPSTDEHRLLCAHLSQVIG